MPGPIEVAGIGRVNGKTGGNVSCQDGSEDGMGGLNAALSIATGALAAQEAAIETVNNNIANVNTPGYSREQVNLSANASLVSGSVAIGQGVNIDSITGVRDTLLDLRVQQQTSLQTSASAQSGVLASVETTFSGTSGTVGSTLSSFFTSLSALSANPTSAAVRQTAIDGAQDVVNAFHQTSASLTFAQIGLNGVVAGDVAKINALSQQLAAVNAKLGGGDSQNGSLADQRIGLEQQLAAVTSISITKTAEGDTVTTGNGTVLVVASRSFALQTTTDSSGLTQVTDSAGTNITKTLTGGDIGGLLQVRDTALPSFLSQLDTLANGFANAVNAAQASGYGLNGSPGGALFTVPATTAGSAAAIALHATDGSAIAASSTPSAGGSGNVSTLTAVQDQALGTGLSPTNSYAALVQSVGTAASEANTQSSALDASLSQLKDQQSAVSGVSIDEESANLLRYQQAYQASAEVISTIRSLFSTTLSAFSGGGL